MKIISFCCENFKNIKNLCLEAHPEMNILYGGNAQGKTNILDGIWLFTGRRSFLGSPDGRLIKNGEKFSKLSLVFEDDREHKINIKLEEKKRSFTVNGVSKDKLHETGNIFSAVIFAPIHLEIASDGPAVRRRFMDDAISQVNLRYADYLSKYEKVLEQRNSLLKDIPKNPSLLDTLDIWDTQLAKLGTILTIYRRDFTEKIAEKSKSIYERFSEESFDVKYNSTIFPKVEDIDKYTDSNINYYYNALLSSREKDIALKYTSVGVHRDDMLLFINGLSVRDYASQGQKRSAVLSLKLAEAEILKEIIGSTPVILFDDVLSELDEKRQEKLLSSLGDFQSFITCCDEANTKKYKGGRVFNVTKGEITVRTAEA